MSMKPIVMEWSTDLDTSTLSALPGQLMKCCSEKAIIELQVIEKVINSYGKRLWLKVR
jgi:hypothetical protein